MDEIRKMVTSARTTIAQPISKERIIERYSMIRDLSGRKPTVTLKDFEGDQSQLMNYDEVPHTDIPSLIRQKIRFLSDDYRSMQHHKEVVIEHTEKINKLEAALDYEAIRDPMHPSGWGLTSAYDRLIYSYRMMDTTLSRKGNHIAKRVCTKRKPELYECISCGYRSTDKGYIRKHKATKKHKKAVREKNI